VVGARIATHRPLELALAQPDLALDVADGAARAAHRLAEHDQLLGAEPELAAGALAAARAPARSSRVLRRRERARA
jgi:hypothetical protein